MKPVNYFFILAVLFASIGGISSDLYLPSLPAIAHSLHSHISLVQLTVATFVLGFSLARFGVATISDAVGRKSPLIISLLICLVGCFCCLVATNIYMLLFGRLLQGVGAGGSNILGRVIMRDKIPGPLLAKYMSYFSMIAMSLMGAAPLLGGYIQHYLGWRACFAVLLCFTVVVLLVGIFLLPETNKFKHPEYLRLSVLKINCRTLFNDSSFLVNALLLAFAYGGFVAWLTSGAVVLQKVILFSPVGFGWCAALVGYCYFTAAYLNSKFVTRFGSQKIQQFGVGCSLIAATIMLISILFFNYISAVAFVGPVMLAVFGFGFIAPNSFAEGLLPFAKIAGIATAILGSMQMVGAFIASTIISATPDRNQFPLGLIIFVGSVLSVMLLIWLKKTKRGDEGGNI